MLVELSKNSWHVKFYKWVIGYNPNYKFKSLCNYFWTIVFYLLCSPLILLWKVIKFVFNFLVAKPIGRLIDRQIENSFKKPNKKRTKLGLWWNRNNDSIATWAGRIWIGFMLSVLGFFLIVGIYELFKKHGLSLGFVYIFATIGIITTIILTGFWLTEFGKSDTWKMIKGMTFSLKNKICPMIKWV